LDSKLQDVVRKIEALLDRAQSTSFPEEAASCQAKAQELMTKYQVEGHELFGKSRDGGITSRNVPVSNPYSLDKATLLHVIAKNNFCRILRYEGYVTIYGYDTDIELVLVMFKSLLIDMASSMARELSKAGKVNTTSWKKSFFAGYASMIGTRLEIARRSQIREAFKSGHDSFALVIKDKESLIVDYWEKLPKSKAAPRSLSSTMGYETGRESARSADIGQTKIGGQQTLSD